MTTKSAALAELKIIPGVGPSIADDLYQLGVRSIAELRSVNPESLYEQICEHKGQRVDRCVLYVFRCARYFASASTHDPEKLKWWNWKGQSSPRIKSSKVSRRRITRHAAPSTRISAARGREL